MPSARRFSVGLCANPGSVGMRPGADHLGLGLSVCEHLLAKAGRMAFGTGFDLRGRLLRGGDDRCDALASPIGDRLVATCDKRIESLLETVNLRRDPIELGLYRFGQWSFDQARVPLAPPDLQSAASLTGAPDAYQGERDTTVKRAQQAR